MGILAKVPEYPQRESTQECRNALGRNQAESAGTPSAGIPPKVPDRPWQQWPPWGFKTAWTPHHPIEVRFVPIGKCVPLCIRVVAKRRHHLEQQFRAPRRLPPIRFKFPVSLPSFYISGFPCFSTSVFQSSYLYLAALNFEYPASLGFRYLASLVSSLPFYLNFMFSASLEFARTASFDFMCSASPDSIHPTSHHIIHAAPSYYIWLPLIYLSCLTRLKDLRNHYFKMIQGLRLGRGLGPGSWLSLGPVFRSGLWVGGAGAGRGLGPGPRERGGAEAGCSENVDRFNPVSSGLPINIHVKFCDWECIIIE